MRRNRPGMGRQFPIIWQRCARGNDHAVGLIDCLMRYGNDVCFCGAPQSPCSDLMNRWMNRWMNHWMNHWMKYGNAVYTAVMAAFCHLVLHPMKYGNVVSEIVAESAGRPVRMQPKRRQCHCGVDRSPMESDGGHI